MAKKKTLLIAGGVAAAAAAVGVGVYLATREQGGSAKIEVIHGTGGDGAGELEVVMRDAMTGTPIAGGTVSVGAGFATESVATDAGGLAVLHPPSNATSFSVTARADGYKSFSKLVTWGAGSQRLTISLDRALSPALDIQLAINCSVANWKQGVILGSVYEPGQVQLQMTRSDGVPLARETIWLWLSRTDLGGLSIDPSEGPGATPTTEGVFGIMTDAQGRATVYLHPFDPGLFGAILGLLHFGDVLRRDTVTIFTRSEKYRSVSASCPMTVNVTVFS